MDESIKRKLVGAAVLVVVAIIVFPLLTPKARNAQYLSESVPKEASVPAMDMTLPKSLTLPQRESVGDAARDSVEVAPISVDGARQPGVVLDRPVVDGSGQAVVWQIQVASFSNPENAIKLRNQLRNKGYKAFEKRSVDGAYVRVFIGPSGQKTSLENQLVRIEKEFKLQGKVVPYFGQ